VGARVSKMLSEATRGGERSRGELGGGKSPPSGNFIKTPKKGNDWRLVRNEESLKMPTTCLEFLTKSGAHRDEGKKSSKKGDGESPKIKKGGGWTVKHWRKRKELTSFRRRFAELIQAEKEIGGAGKKEGKGAKGAY